MARDFDGTDDRLDWANVFTTSGQALTVALWAWFDDLTPTAIEYLWNSAPAGGANGTLLYQQSGVDGRVGFFRTGSTSMNRLSNDNAITTGTWTHVLATSDGSLTAANHHVYINGTEVSYSTTTDGATETTANSTWSLGGRPSDNNRNFDGRLAEVGVWDRVLDLNEIVLLSKGFSSLLVPAGLRFFCPLLGASTEINYLGAASSTLVGTTAIDHPRILGPAPPLVFHAAADSPPSTRFRKTLSPLGTHVGGRQRQRA